MNNEYININNDSKRARTVKYAFMSSVWSTLKKCSISMWAP